jgi:hypothetical protein
MKRLVMLGTLAALMSGFTQAADSGGAWYVSPLLQWWDLDSARRATDHVAGEITLGYAYDDAWAVEVEGAGASFTSYCGCALKLAALSLDGLRKFGNDGSVQPYVIAGIGVIHDAVDRSATTTGPAAEAGVGLLAGFGDARRPAWQWRGEVKYRREFSDQTATRSSVGDLIAGLGLQYNFR